MVTLTDRARDVVRSYLDGYEGESLALRISSRDGNPLAPEWELTLGGADERGADDLEVDAEGIPVLVERASAGNLEGATVDFVERVNESGFEVRTRSSSEGGASPPPGSLPDLETDNDLARRVRDLLDSRINPAIASHGGQINLVGVEGTEIYMEMSGGCQGCAMSRITLRQGVERMLRQELPEISAIHDVTDHQAGENPFY